MAGHTLKACEVLWAKASNNPANMDWLPLYVHLFDTMSVADNLLKEWVPAHTKKVIEDGISGERISSAEILRFLCAAHDIGKATPEFQFKTISNNVYLSELFKQKFEETNLSNIGHLVDKNAVPHSLASEIILERNGVPRCISSIIGSHHGRTPNSSDLLECRISSYAKNTGFKNEEWLNVQNIFLLYAYQISNTSPDKIGNVRLTIGSQVLLSALVILSDWIASNENWFPLNDGRRMSESELIMRGKQGWKNARIPPVWNTVINDQSDIYLKRFDIKQPRSFQKKLLDIVSGIETPGIIVVEAPMGEGKTEAALAASEIFSKRFGMGGAIFALPTQATADGMYPRMKKWVDQVTKDSGDINSIFLAHGKSRYNREYTSIGHYGWNNAGVSDGQTVIHEWFTGKKKGLLSDFTIGTVDNVLMGGLKLRHLALRHLALANKVVIIDECHAYDSYMGSYLVKVIKWLGIYNVPVLLLSATLYPSRRSELIDAYLGKGLSDSGDHSWRTSVGYPCITYTNGMSVGQTVCESSLPEKEVTIKRICDSDLPSIINDVSADGGYIGIVCNTVSKAQSVYRMIRRDYPEDEIHLLHSRFTNIDRSNKEAEILSKMSKDHRCGPPYRMFVIGTQVLEQSLDLDFDVLITELCPIDLLLQRIGRLHRHENVRPLGLQSPLCFVIDDSTGFDKGSEYVYGRYQLYNTRILLGDKVTMPKDIPVLVHAAYSGAPLCTDDDCPQDYIESYHEMEVRNSEKERNAKVFQIGDPSKHKDMLGWLNNNASDDQSGDRALATVRDTNASVEAILVADNGDGTLSPVSGDVSLRLDVKEPIDDNTAFTLAGCKISLPRRFTAGKSLDCTLSNLSKITSAHIPQTWMSTGWLKGEYFLISDREGMIELNNSTMKYTFEEGLVVKNE